MSEVSTERQLELALMLLSKEQREDFAKDLKILQLECSLTDAKRKIHELKHTEAQLKQELSNVHMAAGGRIKELEEKSK